MCESDTMIFGEADGGGELPETPGYAAAEFADRARGGGSRMSAVPFCAILEQGQRSSWARRARRRRRRGCERDGIGLRPRAAARRERGAVEAAEEATTL